MTYPILFKRLMAVPEDVERPPYYTAERLFGQGYNDQRQDASYPYVDYFVIVFFSDSEFILLTSNVGRLKIR